MRTRTFALLSLVSLLILGLMAPALATKPDDVEGHKVTVCHATNSATNPFVVITIDVAAWEDGDGFVRHSSGHHQNSKTDHVDMVWDEETGCGGAPPTTTTTTGPTDT